MDSIFSDRISDVPRSFIREILKVALEPSMISFAGGLPNRDFFPQAELIAATEKVYALKGRDIFQYSNTRLIFGRWLKYKYIIYKWTNFRCSNQRQMAWCSGSVYFRIWFW